MDDGLAPEANAALPLDDWERICAAGAFEETYAALEVAVSLLEAGGLTLSDSVACYEAGIRLAERCEQFLTEAELRVSRLEETVARYTVAEEQEPDLDQS
ncbi:MAG TPA: exodeoxyribonuclease VII small subunit [Thermomicrobiales bacterium]|nr:exodeoxyribonuclease VII small subunit [Thermomicrobiales bacterium]